MEETCIIRDGEDSVRDNNKCRDLHQYLYLYVVCLDFIHSGKNYHVCCVCLT